MQLAPVTSGDDASIAALLDECFGPERHLRTAYRLRSESEQVQSFGRVMRANDGRLLGSIQYWQLALVADDRARPLMLLGPLAVTPAARRHGVGRRLMDATLALADASSAAPVMLIGDPGYYGRFGFSAAATSGWQLPGPVERHRLLLRNPAGVSLPSKANVRGSTLVQMPHDPVTGVDDRYTTLTTV